MVQPMFSIRFSFNNSYENNIMTSFLVFFTRHDLCTTNVIREKLFFIFIFIKIKKVLSIFFAVAVWSAFMCSPQVGRSQGDKIDKLPRGEDDRVKHAIDVGVDYLRRTQLKSGS